VLGELKEPFDHQVEAVRHKQRVVPDVKHSLLLDCFISLSGRRLRGGLDMADPALAKLNNFRRKPVCWLVLVGHEP
jgi:hypothetical protein